MNKTTTGFFIHKAKHSTKAVLCSFFTEDFGKMDLTFFHAKKHREFIPFALYELEFTTQPTYNTGTLKRAALINPQQHHDFNPLISAISFFVCDVVFQSTIHKHKDVPAFLALHNFSIKLNPKAPFYQLPCVFLIDWMKCLGIIPEAVDNATEFNIAEGTMVSNPRIDSPIGVTTLNLLLQNKTVQGRQGIKEAFDLILAYLTYHIPNFNVNKTRTIIHEIFV